MKPFDLTSKEINIAVKLLKSGQIGVMPTDTIYGIVGSALNPKTVEEIYSLRRRDSSKPMIILISSLNDLNLFDISLTKDQKKFLQKSWPNALSVILSCTLEKLRYLHRDKKSLAFRMPKDSNLLEILKQTGPLVAPSANLEKNKPAQTVKEARKYFGNNIPFYVDGGKLESKPSTVIQLYEDGTRIVLREGSFKI